MLYSDSALEQLRTFLNNRGYPYETNQLDEKTVRLNAKIGDYIIPVWFLVDKQIFGFDMINGGSKPYTTIDDFGKYFTTYVYIYTNFIPKAKLIADKFEQDIKINSVYDIFSGNKEEGYTAKFRVLSHPNRVILVSEEDTIYTARLVEYVEDGTKHKLITEYKYELDDVGNVSNVPTIYSYYAELGRLYGDSDTIDIDRVGFSTFVFHIEGMDIKADVLFSYKRVFYSIQEINGVAVDEEVDLDDPYRLQDLYLKCSDLYELNSIDVDVASEETQQETDEASENDSIEESNSTAELETSEEAETSEDISQEVQDETSDDIAQENSEEASEDEVNLEGTTATTEETEQEIQDETNDSEEETSESETNVYENKEDSSLETGNFSVKKVLGLKSEGYGLQFIDGETIYFVDAQVATQLGVPLDRFSEVVSTVEKHGVVMTADEISMHTFSKNVSSDEDTCKKLIFRIFE